VLDGDGAAATDHWFLASGVEVPTTRSDAVVAVLGDSLTDGRGSTTNGNDRWSDVLAERRRCGVPQRTSPW
jgi:lysophospholipase L1-like esterase